ncbi:hypothetical protein M9H77_01542 [Catharanthus roseus]|uniref:Uncharacterized protein n=1 Tax=Catharanthus roseus TaxID=4058 RepID=A0ACC0C5U8_CATRO|nr:hypothetical protein M9H77_01542 [Catharanthus roseus]
MPAARVGHPGRPLVTCGSTAQLLFNSMLPLRLCGRLSNSSSQPFLILSLCLLESSRLLFSSPSPSALPRLISLCSGAFMLLTSLLICHHCLSVGEVREIAVRKEKRERERDRGCILLVISSRLRPVSEGYNPDHHLSSSSSPRHGSAAARRPILV